MNINRRIVLKGATAGAIMALLRGETSKAAPTDKYNDADAKADIAFSANQTVTMLIPGRLYRIGCIIKAQQLSWLSDDLDSYEALNAYLVRSDEDCVFAELGAKIALPSMKLALDMIGDRRVWVWFTRNEPDCIGNMGYVLGTCTNPTLLYGTGGGVLEWINDPAVAITEVRDFLGRIPVESARNGVKKAIGDLDFDFMDAGSKQMFLTQWAFERSTGTMFTSESFGFRHLDALDSQVVVESARNLPSVDAVAKELVARFNWMRESHYQEIIDRFESIFDTYDVEILAPVHGCVIRGRDAVAAHVELALEAMKAASRIPDAERLRYV